MYRLNVNTPSITRIEGYSSRLSVEFTYNWYDATTHPDYPNVDHYYVNGPLLSFTSVKINNGETQYLDGSIVSGGGNFTGEEYTRHNIMLSESAGTVSTEIILPVELPTTETEIYLYGTIISDYGSVGVVSDNYLSITLAGNLLAVEEEEDTDPIEHSYSCIDKDFAMYNHPSWVDQVRFLLFGSVVDDNGGMNTGWSINSITCRDQNNVSIPVTYQYASDEGELDYNHMLSIYVPATYIKGYTNTTLSFTVNLDCTSASDDLMTKYEGSLVLNEQFTIDKWLTTVTVNTDGKFVSGIPWVNVDGEWKQNIAVWINTPDGWKMSV